MGYVELWVTSNFSFLQGASHPEELVETAASYGQKAIAITDRNTLAGIVRAHTRAKKTSVRLIPACRLDLLDGPSVLIYPTTKAAYSSLSGLLTTGNMRAEKGKCFLYQKDVFHSLSACKIIIIPPERLNARFELDSAFIQAVQAYKRVFKDDCYLAACRHYQGHDTKVLFALSELSATTGVPIVATNNVYYHDPERRQLQDILTCIREKKTVHTAGYLLHPNAERHMKTPTEMERLFRKYPEWIARTEEIADACRFSLSDLAYNYPQELVPEGRTPHQQMVYRVEEGLRARYCDQVPEKIRRQVDHELDMIEKMDYAPYFLTIDDICRFARERKILYQARGSAANCACCYYMDITVVDPAKFDMLFERFLSPGRSDPPDVDVDFEHERREEVIQYIYAKYGRDRAAIVATVTQVHMKGAIRDVGKAMGMSEDAVSRLSASVSELTGEFFEGTSSSLQGFDPRSPELRKVMNLTMQYMGFPRQLGQHTGGFVVTDGKLSELCPIFHARMEGRNNIEWNKDDIEALRFLKIDILALGMLTAIRKAFDLVKKHYGRELTLDNIPADDPLVYQMATQADTIGVFQIESRAQQSMLPRMKPTCFYDLVIQVAIVRPGPIVGDMVHPYLKRRNWEEPVEYPSKELEEVLKRTLGVPLFQEQAMKIVMVAAGFTAEEADELRRSMGVFKLTGVVGRLRDKVVAGMLRNGYTKEYALKLFRQLEGFGAYGFPESHAASFAHLVYISLWLKYYFPDVFAVALMNSQPMGYYSVSQLVRDAIRHGISFLPVDINHSEWDNTLEVRDGKHFKVRLGLRQVSGIREEEMLLLLSNRTVPYRSIKEVRNSGVSLATLEKLADADAFRSICLTRRQALSEIKGIKDDIVERKRMKDGTWKVVRQMNLFDDLQPVNESQRLPEMPLSEHVVQDYASTGLSLKAHPVQFVRPRLDRMRCVPAAGVAALQNGDYIQVAGLVQSRQRPGTAKGTCFMTLEDESGTVNLIIWSKVFDNFKPAILHARLFMAAGHVQIEKGVVHVIVQSCFNISPLLSMLTVQNVSAVAQKSASRADDRSGTFVAADGTRGPQEDHGKAFPKSRDFK